MLVHSNPINAICVHSQEPVHGTDVLVLVVVELVELLVLVEVELLVLVEVELVELLVLVEVDVDVEVVGGGVVEVVELEPQQLPMKNSPSASQGRPPRIQ